MHTNAFVLHFGFRRNCRANSRQFHRKAPPVAAHICRRWSLLSLIDAKVYFTICRRQVIVLVTGEHGARRLAQVLPLAWPRSITRFGSSPSAGSADSIGSFPYQAQDRTRSIRQCVSFFFAEKNRYSPHRHVDVVGTTPICERFELAQNVVSVLVSQRWDSNFVRHRPWHDWHGGMPRSPSPRNQKRCHSRTLLVGPRLRKTSIVLQICKTGTFA